MNILIAGGRKKADFLAKSLISQGHGVTIIQDDESYCRILARTHDTPVVYGDATKPHILEEAEVGKADIVTAMTPSDADNLVICQLAKKAYGVRNAFATVNNPRNVEVFKKLGVDSTVSAAYTVAGIIEEMAVVSNISGFFGSRQGKVMAMEIIVRSQYPVTGKTLAEIKFPEGTIIGCIIRGDGSFVPGGGTAIRADDKLVILSSSGTQKEIISLITGKTAV